MCSNYTVAEIYGLSEASVAKTFSSPDGEWQLFRMKELQTFKCDTCGQQKKSKLLAIHAENILDEHCNGCYGNAIAQKEE